MLLSTFERKKKNNKKTKEQKKKQKKKQKNEQANDKHKSPKTKSLALRVFQLIPFDFNFSNLNAFFGKKKPD